MENCVPLITSVSSDDVVSSNLSTEDCHSETVINKRRPVKSGVHTVIDKKIFLKFHKLTKTLKETRTNLLNVDQMLGQYREQPKIEPMNSNNNNNNHGYQSVRTRGRRTASVPPPLRISNCQLCGGDNPQQPRCQSVDNLETIEQLKCEKSPLSRQSQSMQDLRIPPSPVHSTREIFNNYFPGKMDEPVGDALNSARESEVSLGENVLMKSDGYCYFQSTQLASATVEEMKADILTLKTQLQKLELTGHFQNQNNLLCQQVEMKDRIISEMSHHLQELSNKLEISEEQRCQLLLRLEDTLRTSLDVGSEAERFAAEVKRVEEMAAEVQADKDRLRRRARKIVLELKEKCKQYLSDTQKLKEREWELEQKSTLSAQENKLLMSQVTSLQDRLQEVLAELDVCKTKRDELQQRLQKKDLEMAEMKAVYQELQKNVQCYKDSNQKLLSNNEAIKGRYETTKNEKAHLDMRLVAMEKELMLSLQRLEELKGEVKGLRLANSDYQAQLLAESSLRQAVEHAGQEMAEKVNNLENQLTALQNKYLETINDHTKMSEALRQEAVNYKVDEEQKHQENVKAIHLQYESRFTSLKLELAENQARIQSLEEALVKEQESKSSLKNDLAKVHDHDEKYRQLHKSYLNKKKKLQERTNQLKHLQDSFMEVQDVAKSLDNDFKDILYLIYNDVEATVSMMASGSNVPPPTTNVDSQQPKQLLSRDWLSGIKSQLRWIQDEIARLPSSIAANKHHTVSVDSVHTHVPLQSPKVELKLASPEARTSSPPLYLIEKSERSLQTQPQLSEAQDTTTDAIGNEESRSLPYPLNSTEVATSQKSNWESTQSEILKRYQRFQQIFDNINEDFNKSNIRFQSENQADTSKVPGSSGLLSSSLSSISEFSCDAAVEEITSDMVNDVLKADTPGSTANKNSPPN